MNGIDRQIVMTGKERCLRTLRGLPCDRVPVFPLVMGLAAERQGISYRQYASSGSALAEAQISFAERFGLDAVTTCSDAFRVSADLGGRIVFPQDKPPYLAEPLIKCAQDLAGLKRIDVTKGRTGDRVRATAELAKNAKDLLVLGWVDMPFAEACSAMGVSEFLCLLYDEPETAHSLLNFLTECVIDFALAQCEAGCDMVGCGDAAASLVSEEFYSEFAFPYERRVVEAIRRKRCKVKLHICGNTSKILTKLSELHADLYNVDHMVPLEEAGRVYSQMGEGFKGNLDPVRILRGNPEEIYREAAQCVRLSAGKRYFLSGGCEIPPHTPDENFAAFCRAAKG